MLLLTIPLPSPKLPPHPIHTSLEGGGHFSESLKVHFLVLGSLKGCVAISSCRVGDQFCLGGWVMGGGDAGENSVSVTLPIT